MRRAMAEAEVGDAWYGDDPTVNRLQERAAERLGKEAGALRADRHDGEPDRAPAALLGPGHLVACGGAAPRGDDEVMTAAALPGIAYRTVDAGPRGWIDAEQAAAAAGARRLLRRRDGRPPVGREHRGWRGRPRDAARGVAQRSGRWPTTPGVPIHLDGARLFNAAAAAGVDAAEIAAEVDTVMFCLSKGLGAPIGSVLCGPAEMAARPGGSGSCTAAPGARPGSSPRPACRARGGPRAAARGPRAGSASRRGGRRAVSRARSTSSRLKRTWSSSTPKPWGSRCSTRSTGWRPSGWARPTPGGKVRMVTHARRRRRRASRSRWTPGVAARSTEAKERLMALFSKNYPPEIAPRIPPGQRLVKTWPVLHYGPIPNFDGHDWDLELTGLVENPVHALVPGAPRAAERRRARRHALRDRLDDARQHVARRAVPRR